MIVDCRLGGKREERDGDGVVRLSGRSREGVREINR